MTDKNLSELTIKKAHELMQSGSLSARELAVFYLDNIEKRDNDINAYLEVFDDVLEQAEKVDKEIKSGNEISPLAGIPMAIKDNILIKGRKCSAASKILENYTAAYGATVTDKLKKKGAIFLGRTNMDEFAMGSSTENSAYFKTKNPHDLERVPGGSSGGSAAAVAQGECLAALGSDTGGSIRQPAAFCGVVGLKPTYGTVSRHGLMAMASSLDQIGPLAKTVEDAEIIFNTIKGKDAFDSSMGRFENNKTAVEREKMVIGVPKEFLEMEGENKGVDLSIVEATKKAIEKFKDSGCEIKEISLETLNYVTEVYYIIMSAEVSSNLARYDGIKYGFSKKEKDLLENYLKTRGEGFGKEAKRRILLGTYVLSAGYYDAYYGHAQKVRQFMENEFKQAFGEVDAIIGPTTPTPAFKIGEKISDPVQMYLNDIFTVAANLVGVPAISVPSGFSETEGKKLPIGLQIMAPWFEEEKLFNLGKLFEEKK